MTAEPRSPEEIKKMDRKQIRHQFPSGWMVLTRNETLVLVIDALLEAPETKEFTHEALAKQAGTVPERLHNHINSLIELSVVESVEGSDGTEYTLNADSPVVDRLYELNGVVQRVQDVDEGAMPENDDSEGRCRR